MAAKICPIDPRWLMAEHFVVVASAGGNFDMLIRTANAGAIIATSA